MLYYLNYYKILNDVKLHCTIPIIFNPKHKGHLGDLNYNRPPTALSRLNETQNIQVNLEEEGIKCPLKNYRELNELKLSLKKRMFVITFHQITYTIYDSV